MRFSEELINWYLVNKRDLPWRNSRDPYVIWLSEIILQQTRVNQGLDYFNSFLENFPTVEKLANASESKVLKLWQGLGYYSRARNLHYTAQFITNKLNGEFPKKHEDILNLKGVGEYTAAAIASFSYDLPYPVIDGNVYRVLSRIYGITTPIDSTKGKAEFKKLAFDLLNKSNPAIHNQAIMEFGALQCKPKSPNCNECVFKLECFALNNNKIELLPIKEKKIKQRDRFFNYLVLNHNGKTCVKQRVDEDIWKGLYDFPLIETKQNIIKHEDLFTKKFITLKGKIKLKGKSETYKHILSHQKIYATFWEIETDNLSELNSDYLKINKEELFNYPVPKLIENYIKSLV